MFKGNKFNFSDVQIPNLPNEIRKYKQIDLFLDHINQKNISIFLPNECFITVFHKLLESLRVEDFKKLTKLIRNKQIDSSRDTKFQTDLVTKFASNIQIDEDELEWDQIIELYSDLKDVLVNGMVSISKEKVFLDDLEFVSSELKKIAVSSLDILEVINNQNFREVR
jgi:hypothetical protein